MNTLIKILKNRQLQMAGLILMVILVPAFSSVGADSTEKKPASVSLYHVKNGDGGHTIKVTLSSMGENGRTVIPGEKIGFFGGSGLSLPLGEAVTNGKGQAVLTIPKTKLPPPDPDGILTLGVKYPGSPAFEGTEDQVTVKDLTVLVTPKEDDSSRTLTATVFEWNDKKEKVPLKEVGVIFYVPRLFSYLKIGEGTLDSTGQCSIEFPLNLPGDSAGKVPVIAKIEDHEVFGNVEGSTIVPWGEPTLHQLKESYRALWSQVAPTWMVVTLIILLLGVWGHYAFAVYKLVKISKAGKKA